MSRQIFEDLEKLVPVERRDDYRKWVAYSAQHTPTDEIGQICTAAGWLALLTRETPGKIAEEHERFLAAFRRLAQDHAERSRTLADELQKGIKAIQEETTRQRNALRLALEASQEQRRKLDADFSTQIKAYQGALQSAEGKLLEIQTAREAFMVQMKNATQSMVSEMGTAARKARQALDLFGHATLFAYLGLGGFGASVAMFLIIVFLRKGILERDWLLFIPVAISIVVALVGKRLAPKSADESA